MAATSHDGGSNHRSASPIEALEVDKHDPSVVVKDAREFADALESKVSKAAWDILKTALIIIIMCPGKQVLNDITDAITVIKTKASTAKRSPGSFDPSGLFRALHSYNQAQIVLPVACRF